MRLPLILHALGVVVEESDAQLVTRAKGGDRRSFDLLVQRHHNLVYNTAYRMLGDAGGAEDATQTAFIRAYRSLSRFRGKSAFSTWLYRIVSNVCLDALRTRRDDSVGLEVSYDGDDEVQQRPLPDESAEPAANAERSELQRVVHRAISQLPEDYRMVLVLYDITGFSYEEIAGILQIPLGTVKSRLNRARLALRDVIAPDLELFA